MEVSSNTLEVHSGSLSRTAWSWTAAGLSVGSDLVVIGIARMLKPNIPLPRVVTISLMKCDVHPYWIHITVLSRGIGADQLLAFQI